MKNAENSKIWWAEPMSAYVKRFAVTPYFSDVDLEIERSSDMAKMERYLSSYQPCPPEFIPDELRWYQKTVTEKDRNLPDAFSGHAGAPVVSEAMRDVLSEFDLGSTQFFELPLYELKATGRAGATEADRSKKDPRRWFLMHVTEIKDTLRPEHCIELDPGHPRNPGLHRVFGNQNPTIALDRETALSGPPIWRDPKILHVYFFADAIKSAMAAKALRTPAFKFKLCLLV